MIGNKVVVTSETPKYSAMVLTYCILKTHNNIKHLIYPSGGLEQLYNNIINNSEVKYGLTPVIPHYYSHLTEDSIHYQNSLNVCGNQ